MLKTSLLFIKIYKLHEQITWEFLGLRMRNFQGIIFIWTQTYREIFKSALVNLKYNKLKIFEYWFAEKEAAWNYFFLQVCKHRRGNCISN